MIDGAVEWNDKLKALANEMMETFHLQGLTCAEVSVIMMNVSMRVSDDKICSRANLFEFFQRGGNAIDTHAIIRIDSGCKGFQHCGRKIFNIFGFMFHLETGALHGQIVNQLLFISH